MKKIMLVGLLLALGSTAMAADSAQSVLKKAREDYYKQQEAQKKAGRVSEKVEKVKKEKAPKKVDEVETVEVEEEEEVKPRTAMEKLEYNANKAAVKVDFYERVVRSVEREEKELENYEGTLKLNRVKEKKMKRSEERREKVQKKKK